MFIDYKSYKNKLFWKPPLYPFPPVWWSVLDSFRTYGRDVGRGQSSVTSSALRRDPGGGIQTTDPEAGHGIPVWTQLVKWRGKGGGLKLQIPGVGWDGRDINYRSSNRTWNPSQAQLLKWWGELGVGGYKLRFTNPWGVGMGGMDGDINYRPRWWTRGWLVNIGDLMMRWACATITINISWHEGGYRLLN